MSKARAQYSVARLLTAKAPVNTRDANGNTSLIIAAEKGRVELVRLLLANGADVHAQDAKGWIALQSARDVADARGKTDIVHLLDTQPGQQKRLFGLLP